MPEYWAIWVCSVFRFYGCIDEFFALLAQFQVWLTLFGLELRWLDWRSVEDRFSEAILEERQKVLVVSTGGVGTSSMKDYLVALKVSSYSNAWRFGGIKHLSRPIMLEGDLKGKLRSMIYVFGDPIVSICSLKRRGLHAQVFRELAHRTHFWRFWYSDLRLLEVIFLQFKAWTRVDPSLGYPILRLTHNDTFDSDCLRASCGLLGGCQASALRVSTPLKKPRATSKTSHCVKRLTQSLWFRHRKMVIEMESYNNRTFCQVLKSKKQIF